MNNQLINHNNKIVFSWLCLCALMVIIMVAIGGYTRLTNSGLSIVEWKPITGVIPPFSDSDWETEFSKYKESPEYKYINHDIDISHFKNIYIIEYLHRLAGRLAGLIFFIPAIFFLATKALHPRTIKYILLIAFAGVAQGFMGWYMVKSGLKDAPYVSHFRLALHLTLALVIYDLLITEALNIRYGEKVKYSFIWKILVILLFIQIFIGGLVAGLDAGKIYNQFPKMGNGLIPDEIFSVSFSNYLHEPAIVQFMHRNVAYVIAGIVFYLSIDLLDKKNYPGSISLLITILIQIILGICTLLFNAPIYLALIHQVFAFILFALVITIARFSN